MTVTPGSRNLQVVYFLHGSSGDEHSWESPLGAGAMVRRAWAEMQVEAPIVIAVSFGPEWLLIEPNGDPESGLLDVFVSQVVPRVEREHLLQPPARRLLMGVSMGGYSAAQLLLKPGGVFDRVALVCPALVAFDPFDEISVRNYAARTGANQILAQGVAAILREYYPDPATWRADSPLVAGGQLFSARTSPFHISCGVSDELGFYEGAQAFAHLAAAKQAPVTWRPLPGGHCAIDAAEVASYLAP